MLKLERIDGIVEEREVGLVERHIRPKTNFFKKLNVRATFNDFCKYM